jgi:hypothetical protein
MRRIQLPSLTPLVMIAILAGAACGEPDPPASTNTSMVDSSTSTAQVDTAASPAPTKPFTVYWLGERFDPTGDVPVLSVEGEPRTPSPLFPFDLTIDYASHDGERPVQPAVRLEETRSERWGTLLALVRKRDEARQSLPYWEHPCWAQREVALDGGHAIVYYRDGTLPDQPTDAVTPAQTDCAPAYAELYAHVFLDDTAIRVTVPDTESFLRKSNGTPGPTNPYFSHAGVDAVLRALQPKPDGFVDRVATAVAATVVAGATARADTATYQVGETAIVGDLAVTVQAVQRADSARFRHTMMGDLFLIVDLMVENRGATPADPNLVFSTALHDASGQMYHGDFVQLSGPDGSPRQADAIAPGDTLRAELGYIGDLVDESASTLWLVIAPDAPGGSRAVVFELARP